MVVVAASCRFDLPKVLDADAPSDVDVDGALPPPPYRSCIGLTFTCGPSGTGYCCDPAMMIPGGTFLRGYDAATDAYDDMNYPATVSSFVLDKYEVTVGRFRKFVEALRSPPAAGAGAHPKLPSSGWDSAWYLATATLKDRLKCNSTHQTWTDAPGLNENKPINCVTWYEAMAFCIWDGGYLPTEAEWSYAAMGGEKQRAYPWSVPSSSLTIDCSYANYHVNSPSGMYCANGTTGGATRVGSKSPTGDGRWGHSDLAGNVREWVLDWYVSPYPYAQTCTDCANLTASTGRVFLGGDFLYDAPRQRAAYRNLVDYPPDVRYWIIGFRCARTP